jgi:hypothetical protein
MSNLPLSANLLPLKIWMSKNSVCDFEILNVNLMDWWKTVSYIEKLLDFLFLAMKYHETIIDLYIYRNNIFCVWTGMLCISSKMSNIRISQLRDRLSLFGRSVNCWRVSALARSYQLFTDRPNNHSRSRDLRTFLYEVADL